MLSVDNTINVNGYDPKKDKKIKPAVSFQGISNVAMDMLDVMRREKAASTANELELLGSDHVDRGPDSPYQERANAMAGEPSRLRDEMPSRNESSRDEYGRPYRPGDDVLDKVEDLIIEDIEEDLDIESYNKYSVEVICKFLFIFFLFFGIAGLSFVGKISTFEIYGQVLTETPVSTSSISIDESARQKKDFNDFDNLSTCAFIILIAPDFLYLPFAIFYALGSSRSQGSQNFSNILKSFYLVFLSDALSAFSSTLFIFIIFPAMPALISFCLVFCSFILPGVVGLGEGLIYYLKQDLDIRGVSDEEILEQKGKRVPLYSLIFDIQGGLGLMYVWASGRLGVWASGLLGIGASGHLGIWASGHQGFSASGLLSVHQSRTTL